jgi:hypothetical protein
MSFRPALAMVFVGEAVSIGVMEVAMNAVDFAMGGMGVKSLFALRYWEALAVAAVAGFLGAWPVNFWLLGRNMKKCHHAAHSVEGLVSIPEAISPPSERVSSYSSEIR